MKIDYIELPALDLAAMKRFYGEAFGWEFEDWGPAYVAFSKAGLEGGFAKTEQTPPRGGAIIILATNDLDAAEKGVEKASGKIVAHHEFPGGKRFHFLDPSGNELAVWTKT